mmetsp:Transcript_52402/g.161344  ORF Transcript_52402/g.161344 Transcript_52402/m.161344 type:complete len:424 (-) Transcript_52402:135-1406(-)
MSTASSPQARSPALGSVPRDTDEMSAARTDDGAEASPSPQAPHDDDREASPLHELTAEEERSLQADRRRLARALQEAENREADLIARHRREVEQLRSELERSVNDRQQLEQLVEEAQGEKLAAEDSLSVQQGELAEADRLRRRLAHEATAAAELRDELEAAREAVASSARETSAAQQRLREAREELEAERKKAQAVQELKASEAAEFDRMLAAAIEGKKAAEERCRAMEREQAELLAAAAAASPNAKSPGAGGAHDANTPGPKVPQLRLAARNRGASVASTVYHSPDPLGQSDSARDRSTSCARFAIGNVNSDSPNTSIDRPPEAVLYGSPPAGPSDGNPRGWRARHRRNDSSDPTPRGSSEVVRPPGDASPIGASEQSPLMRPTRGDREAQESAAGPNRRPPPKKGGAKKEQKKASCPCIVA